jgi:DNA-binding NtrC family response regulator
MDRVLVVDDERHVLNSIRLVLQIDGFEVVTASSGEDAVKRLKEGEFGVMVSDLCMSPMDGMELLRYVREWKPSMPVIMLTGYSSPGTRAEAEGLGVFDYLVKPATAAAILRSVRNAIGRSAGMTRLQ